MPKVKTIYFFIEVLDYARRLGINPDAEPYLLDLAREGLMAALPEGWQPCYLEPQNAWYYYHAATETTTWEHPLDAKYKEIVEQTRAGRDKQHDIGMHNVPGECRFFKLLLAWFLNNIIIFFMIVR